MTWYDIQLTTKQAERALQAAGLPIDPAEWSPEQVEQASQVLDRAAGLAPVEPKHGEERNRHYWRAEQGICGHEGTRAEKYCRHCKAWQPVGAGLVAGLLGWVICPTCHHGWTE